MNNVLRPKMQLVGMLEHSAEEITTLAGLHDVEIENIRDNDILVYNSSVEKWQNSQALEDVEGDIGEIQQDIEDLKDATEDIPDMKADILAIEGKLDNASATLTGNPLSFNTDEAQLAKSTIITLEPIQDLHGFTKPWVGGAGKNKANFVDGYSIDVSGYVVPYTSSSRCATIEAIPIVTGATYKVAKYSGSPFFIYAVWNDDTLVRREANVLAGTTVNTSGGNKLYVCAYDVTVASGKPMVVIDTIPNTYEPYENICPISGRASVDVDVAEDSESAPEYELTIAFGQTVYGCTHDVENGVLRVETESVTFDGSNDETIGISDVLDKPYKRIVCGLPNSSMTWTDSATVTNKLWSDKFKEVTNTDTYRNDVVGICYRVDGSHNVTVAPQVSSITDVASARAWLSANPTQIVFTYATPIEINLTPHQILLLKGANYITTDGNSITITYNNGSVATYADLADLYAKIKAYVDYKISQI